MRDEKGKLLVAGIILMLACLGVILWTDWRDRKNQAEAYEAKQEEKEPLVKERRRLQRELEELTDIYNKKISGTGTVSIIFTDTDEKINIEILPVMEAFGYTGVLAVEKSKMPGGEGLLTEEEFRDLVETGWQCCPAWTEGDTIEDIAAVRDRLTEIAGVTAPMVLFEEGVYSSDKDDLLFQEGFTIAVHHGEEGLPVVAAADGSELWHPGAVGLMGKEPRYRLEDAVAQKRNIIYIVGFEKEDEMYNRDSFLSMLNYIEEAENKDGMIVLTPDEARAYLTEIMSGAEALQAELDEKSGELEEELREVEKELEEIQD